MWPFERKLEDVICPTKNVKVLGVKFKIKKLDPSNFLDGSKVMLQMYDIYKLNKSEKENQAINLDKIKEHYRDIFMSCVLHPEISRKPDPDKVFVDNLFTDWSLAHNLYNEIMSYTYGKKKLKLSI